MTLGKIYHDIQYGTARWYHIVWFYICMTMIFVALSPAGLWRLCWSQTDRSEWIDAWRASRERRRSR